MDPSRSRHAFPSAPLSRGDTDGGPAPAAEVADVVEELAEREEPVLCPGGPGFGLRDGLWSEPPADTYDLGTGVPEGLGFLVWVWRVLGHVDWGVAIDAVLQVSG